MADLSELLASQSIKIAGCNPSTGAESYWVQADVNGNLFVRDVLDGAGVSGNLSLTANTAAEAKVGTDGLNESTPSDYYTGSQSKMGLHHHYVRDGSS